MKSRRQFLKQSSLAVALPFGLGGFAGARAEERLGGNGEIDRRRMRALLISATTLAGRQSLEHARPFLSELFEDRREILLVNFASLPQDRDAYEARMQRDFESVGKGYRVRSLHRASGDDVAAWIREAEGFFVSGGNTFLLLRSLYDRYVVELLRERILIGVPYAGSSAGSNIAGVEIGTTNDFPICDVPTRRSLGLFQGLYNPHHPDESESEEAAFASRRWKIGQFCELWPDKQVIGVTNPGMLWLESGQTYLVGEGATAFVRRGSEDATIRTDGEPVGIPDQA